jgi:hypothetical protein
MERFQKAIVAFFVVILFGFTHSERLESVLTIAELKDDVGVLRKALEKYHPGLYWYTSKEAFEVSWDSLDRKISQPLTEIQFFRSLLPVVAKVKCAHTLFYPSSSIMGNGKRFPMDIRFVSGKAYLISESTSQSGISKGSELLSINGRNMEEITRDLLGNLQAQGGNTGWKYVILENDFQNYYHYLIEQTDRFSLAYVDHETGERKTATVMGINEPSVTKHWKNWYPEKMVRHSR